MDLAGYALEPLREEPDAVLYRGRSKKDADSVLILVPAPGREGVTERIDREFALAPVLAVVGAVRPLALGQLSGRRVLVLEDTGGFPLQPLDPRELDLEWFLNAAIGSAAALAEVHRNGFVHRDVRPGNIIIDEVGAVRLTGFGFAVRLPLEPSIVTGSMAGTLAYMSPEQTGRLNRSVDTRSDLYSLGVTLYEMLTGELPFVASEPMEWIHSHIARHPMPLRERVSTLPEMLEAIVLKLLAKAAEDRYQSIVALEYDLRRCLDSWTTRGRIDAFALAAKDRPDRLRMPATLYGRERQVQRLLAGFDRVARLGETEVVLVSGPAGAGKSSVVGQLQSALVAMPSLFAAGKFDQYKRDIPYATLAQAFKGLVRQILTLEDADLDHRRRELLAVLGPNGQLMVDLVPELAVIIGEQAPPPDLGPEDRQNRFQLVFRRFLSVFARPEQPLVLFLDDLQWLDTATLVLVEHLVTHPEVRHLLLVGAYRDNEVAASHPLARMLARIRQAGKRVEEVLLAPLLPDDVERLLADALQTGPERARPLAGLVFEKTGGNPFFTIQFLIALTEEALLAFDPAAEAWTWDLPRIRTKGFTDNVADLMAAKLSRLPDATRRVLGLLACLGHVTGCATLSLVYGGAEEAMHAALQDAVQVGLVVRSETTYAFLHDRIQEAAYGLILEGERASVHFRIGLLLAARATPEELEESIFDIVSHFARGAALITNAQEREKVARLNLMAGKRAKAATAYSSALHYFSAGRALLIENGWERHYQLVFDLELNWAECEYLSGALGSAEARLSALSMRTRTTADSAAVTCVLLNLYTTLDRSDSAVEVGLDYLQRIDVEWSRRWSEEDIRQAYGELWSRLEAGSIEALVDLPRMSDPDQRATMNVLTALLSPAQFTDLNLFRRVIFQMAALSLEYGNIDASCLAYALLGSVLAIYLSNPQAGSRFGRLALDLVERRGLDRLRGSVYSVFTLHLAHWTQHLRACRIFLLRAFEAARDAGDLTFAAFSRVDLITILLASGEPLGEVEREAESALEFVRGARFGLISDVIVSQIRLVRILRGKTWNFNSFSDAEFDEVEFEQHLENDPRLSIAASRYWIRKLQARVYAGDYASAIAAATKVASLLWTLPTQIELPEFHFYAGLAWAGHYASLPADERPHHMEELAAHHRQISDWAESGPENFTHRAALLGAELARLQGRELDAMRLYEEAIRSARQQGFVHAEGIGNELAGRFHGGRGFDTIAEAYLRNARSCYLRWGADAKVSQLDRSYPELGGAPSTRPGSIAHGTELKHLDLAAVIGVSQAVSGEIVIDRLVERLMTIVLEHAGAVRGLLLLPLEGKMRIVATAISSVEGVQVHQGRSETEGELPESILNVVSRTHEVVILDDASAVRPYSSDAYVLRMRSRSVLYLPLVRQKQLVGVLYLENALSSHIFTPDRVSLLRILASQAAISIENARLYQDRERMIAVARQAESELRLTMNLAPVMVWSVYSNGLGAEFNDRWYKYTGISPEAARNGGWLEAFHPDDRSNVADKWHDLIETAQAGEVEARLLRHDGASRSFLVRATPLRDEDGKVVKWYGTHTDIEDIIRAEQAHEALARGSRLTAVGELTVSIAHEVNQPLMAIVTNAATCLQWLREDRLNIAEARRAAERINADGHRAGEIIASIRSLARNSQPVMAELDLNEAVRDVLALMRGELQRRSIVVETDFERGAPLGLGDRVQIQQVVMNLLMNGIEAIDSTNDGPRIVRVQTSQDEPGYIQICIADTGSGLDPARMERMFDAFFTTKAEGIGIGLSICRSIVQAHRGRLWASPGNPRGSEFRFTVPAACGAT